MAASPSHFRAAQLNSTLLKSISHLVAENLETVFPAVALAVIHGGVLLLDASWGWVDPESRQYEVTPETLFDLASVTKLFTTTAFLSLVAERKTQLDTPLVEIIPEFGAGGMRSVDGGQDPHTRVMLPVEDGMLATQVDPSKVTMRHLLLHNSGLAPWRAVYAEAGPPPEPPYNDDPLSRQERWSNAVRALCSYPFVGVPGDKVRYSDLGLMLLGEAISRLHGTPGDLESAVRVRVLDPMNLARVCYNPLRSGYNRPETVPTEYDGMWRRRRAWGEVHDENACGVGGVAGHAGLFANARSIAEFGQAWLDGAGIFGIDPVLAHEATTQQIESDGMRRGLGWLLKARVDSGAGDLMNIDTFGHTGFTGTSLFIDPTRELVIVCLTNRVYPGRDKPGIHAFRRAMHDLVVGSIE